MAKTPRTLTAKLPGYERDRGEWRKGIHTRVLQAAAKAGIHYEAGDALEVIVLLYLTEGKRLTIHDVDNRLKDIMDALQGRFAGSRVADRLIENDNCVCRVVMEKQKIPKGLGDDAGGILMIRPYREHRWPLQVSKGHRLLKPARRRPTRR